MQDKPENEEIEKTTAVPEEELRRQEAEAKVAEMFAAAKTVSKRDKKKKSPSDEEISALEFPEDGYGYEEDDEELPGLFSRESLSKLRRKKEPDNAIDLSELTEKEYTPEEAEEKIAKVFAAASAQQAKSKAKSSPMSMIGLELALLESLSFFLFIASMRSGIPGPFSPVAIFLPIIIGMGYRMIFQQLNLFEAASKCKPHIIIAVFFYVCLLITI
ncbi:hypothetical protein [uncultured Ruminococcus sp.]|uniref:hypothetical protein n=1 Tax=uncultured Ruminococcus sp. TaxID=165186 RepID=UPI002611BFEB|nr:hypothetical protein [uncultured Ruminococcus sp.]